MIIIKTGVISDVMRTMITVPDKIDATRTGKTGMTIVVMG